MLLYRKYVLPILTPEQTLLEVGPNVSKKSVSSYLLETPNPPRQWDTIDIQAVPQVTYQATSEYSFPIPDNTYDIVFSAQVIEHVRKPWIWMKELARVCKPGGRVITINPVSWPYHEAPVDCWRIYPEGHRAMAEECGLTVELAVFDCLELGGYRRRRWGSTVTRRTPWSIAIRKALRMRVEGAFDTICISRK